MLRRPDIGADILRRGTLPVQHLPWRSNLSHLVRFADNATVFEAPFMDDNRDWLSQYFPADTGFLPADWLREQGQ